MRAVAESKWMMALMVFMALNAKSTKSEDIFNWNNNNWSPQLTKGEESKVYRRSTEAQPTEQTATIQDRNYAVYENQNFNINETNVSELIDQIINSRREGRNLNEYNELYADGNIDEALMQGNDMEARNLVRDKLCALGLMSCEIESKGPLYSTIYAQRPPHPVRYGGGPYGSPKPMNLPGHHKGYPYTHPTNLPNKFIPPRKVGYAGPFKPSYSNPSPLYNGPSASPPTAVIFNKPPIGSTIFGSKPPASEYIYEKPDALEFGSSQHTSLYSPGIATASTSSSITSAQQQNILLTNNQNGNSNGNLQQHVHHHYHHLEGAANEASKTTSISLPITSGQNTKTDFSTLAQSSAVFTSDFNGASQNSGLHLHNVKPNNILDHSYVSNFNPINPSQVGSSYHTQNPNYYKKELHNVDGISAAFSSYNTLTAGGYSPQNGPFDTSRNQYVETQCQCVPYHQCPAADRIGRKEDLILPIDPRNLATNIAALNEDEATSNTTARTQQEQQNNDSEARMNDPNKRSKRDTNKAEEKQSNDANDLHIDSEGRAYYGLRPNEKTCRINEVCCRRPLHSQLPSALQYGRCGVRHAAGITGRIKTPIYVDGNSEFAEYPWHVAILKKDPKESVYACGATLIDAQHVITAAHCIKSQNGHNLKARLGEWDVNNDVEFFPYIERDVVSVHIHPEYYAGTLDNDLAVLKLDHPIDFIKNPHISPACLPEKFSDYAGARCWTTGWGKDAFGEQGKYQNILKEVDVPVLSNHQCEMQLRHTRLGYSYKLNPGFLCAGGEDGKDACKGDGGGPLVCEHNGIWNVIGVVSWGIGCGQVNVPGVYVRVSHYLDWIHHITQYNK